MSSIENALGPCLRLEKAIPQKNRVITQSHGVINPCLKGHGDSRSTKGTLPRAAPQAAAPGVAGELRAAGPVETPGGLCGAAGVRATRMSHGRLAAFFFSGRGQSVQGAAREDSEAVGEFWGRGGREGAGGGWVASAVFFASTVFGGGPL